MLLNRGFARFVVADWPSNLQTTRKTDATKLIPSISLTLQDNFKMPSVPLTIASSSNIDNSKNPLPQLLHTPSGLAILEIQGTINLPEASADERSTQVGRLEFPYYVADDPTGSTSWQKTVHLYVGKHQRLTGEIKKLQKPLAVLRKPTQNDEQDALEIAEIIYYKIIFSHRPEPVSE